MKNVLEKFLPQIPTDKEDITGNLSKNLKQLMLQADIDSQELSQHTSLTISSINRLRSAASCANPTVTTLAPIANYFGVSIENLIGDSLGGATYTGDINITSATLIQVPVIKLDEVIAWSDGFVTREYAKWVNTELAVGDRAFAIESGADDLVNHIHKDHTIHIIDLDAEINHYDYALVTEKTNQKKPSLRQVLMDGDDIYLKPMMEGLNITFCESPTFYGCVVQTIVNY
ncbi:helix-turn-helix transcriptional regulator [Vibrio profundum]|uniref:helix-turn-helix domain-containing protein n=1 Tax=Vibrio profundum TaxID=2910247 RepID=UPI003D097209